MNNYYQNNLEKVRLNKRFFLSLKEALYERRIKNKARTTCVLIRSANSLNRMLQSIKNFEKDPSSAINVTDMTEQEFLNLILKDQKPKKTYIWSDVKNKVMDAFEESHPIVEEITNSSDTRSF